MINCVICDRKRDEEFGHNPSPVKDEGRCCTFCNTHIVIPARISAERPQDDDRAGEARVWGDQAPQAHCWLQARVEFYSRP